MIYIPIRLIFLKLITRSYDHRHVRHESNLVESVDDMTALSLEAECGSGCMSDVAMQVQMTI